MINRVPITFSSIRVKDCKVLITHPGAHGITHSREAISHKVVDNLVDMGVYLEDRMLIHISSPNDIIPLLEADLKSGF